MAGARTLATLGARMSSQARAPRAEERRLSIRTLAIASASSATAAIISSRLWTAGTPIAAAMTPVVVALVGELLNRPTERIAERLTVQTDALPEAAGAGAPPPRDAEREAAPAPDQPRADRPGARPAQSAVRRPRDWRRFARLRWKPIAATATLAFVIGLAVLSLPQVVAGRSLLKGSPPGFGTASNSKGGAASKGKEDAEDPAGAAPSGADPQRSGNEAPADEPAEEPAPETTPEETEAEPPPENEETPPEAPPASPAP